MYLRSSETSSKKKIFGKSEYFMGIKVGVLFGIKAAICTLQKRLISLSWLLLKLFREATCTTKVSYSKSRAAAVNSFFSTSLTCLIVKKAFLMV